MIHEQLRQARRVAGMSQKDLAKSAGISANTISLFERGASQGLATSYKIAEALGMQLMAVAKAETPPPPTETEDDLWGV